MPQLIVYARQQVVTVPLEHLNGELKEAELVVAADLDLPSFWQQLSPELSLKTISFGETVCAIAHRQLTVHRSPCTGAPTSDARYWIVHPLPEQRTLLLLQYLPPFGRTSAHWHLEEDERFHCLLGSCTLLEGWDDPTDLSVRGPKSRRRLAAQSTWSPRDGHADVASGVVHQLETAREPALNLIVIRGTSARTLKELDRRYVCWD